MTLRTCPLLAALVAAVILAANGARAAEVKTAVAAASAPVLIIQPAASAPLPAKRQTRPLTAAEKRESAAPPGELRPERTITPQLTIPLGKNAPDASVTKPRSTGLPPTGTSTGTGLATSGKPAVPALNDSAGRCAAIADEHERAMCREAAGLGKPKR